MHIGYKILCIIQEFYLLYTPSFEGNTRIVDKNTDSKLAPSPSVHIPTAIVDEDLIKLLQEGRVLEFKNAQKST
jgi:hypothetical protein